VAVPQLYDPVDSSFFRNLESYYEPNLRLIRKKDEKKNGSVVLLTVSPDSTTVLVPSGGESTALTSAEC
jgi:hypothetical protein